MCSYTWMWFVDVASGKKANRIIIAGVCSCGQLADVFYRCRFEQGSNFSRKVIWYHICVSLISNKFFN